MRNSRISFRLTALLLCAAMMCLAVVPAAAANISDVVTVSIDIYDMSTGNIIRNAATMTVAKKTTGWQTENIRIPELSTFPNIQSYGRVVKVSGNFAGISGTDCGVGQNVAFTNNNDTAIMTYYVTYYGATSGGGSSGSGGTISIGTSGSKNWNCTVKYHSNYPDGTDYVYTQVYNVTCYTTIYNTEDLIGLSQAGFSAPVNFSFLGWSNEPSGSVGTNIALKQNATLHRYAQYKPAQEITPTTYTVTYVSDGDVVATHPHIKVGDEVLTETVIEAVTEEGFSFKDWTDGTTTYQPGDTFTVTEDITLTAEMESAGYHITVDNRVTNQKFAVAMTDLDADKLYKGSVTFTVACEYACAVGIVNGDGTYTRLTCTDNGGKHTFTVDVQADMTIVVVLKGDATLNGKLGPDDATNIRTQILDECGLDALQYFAADLNGNGKLEAAEVTNIRMTILDEDSSYIAW